MLRASLSIRTRILAIALIPSLALLGIGVGTAGYLVREGQQSEDWAALNREAAGHAGEVVSALEQERKLSLWQLSGERGDRTALTGARDQLDAAFESLTTYERQMEANPAGNIGADTGGFDTLKKKLPAIRGAIDAGRMPIADTYALYNRILDAVALGTNIVLQTAPDTNVALELAAGLRILHAMEGLSRSAALTAAELHGQLQDSPMNDEYRNLVGFYRTELPQLAADLGANPVAGKIKAVLSSPQWRQVAAMEDYLIAQPTDEDGDLAPPPISFGDWRTAQQQLSQEVMDAWLDLNHHANSVAVQDGKDTATNSLWAGAGVLSLAIMAFFLSLWLANRLIGRLRRLRTQTLALAEHDLPETMRKLSAGEQVDTESGKLDFGHDEIGSVANAFNRAHSAAVSAAINESRTREGVRAVFLNIAHRSQMVVHRQLEVLDEAEQRQEDPALLETFFRLDHLATRERRNAENLIILGGGEPGRQWRRPVPLVELVRSAIGETLDYARVRPQRMPQVFVVGTVVADLIHLLAELVDNATAFSPPQSRVEVSSNVVGKGVAIEIIDQGMGMSADERDEANEMLRNPPDFGVATLSANSRLGLFVVAQLGARHEIKVRLGESEYGGIRAIVLVPTSIVAADAPLADHLPQRLAARRPESAMTGELPALGANESAPTTVATLTPPPPAPAAPPPQAFSETPHPGVTPRRARPGRGEKPPPRDTSTGGHTGRPPLPRRRRQASLAPELAHDLEPDEQAQQQSRSADQARDLMSAIENGTRQGRHAAPQPGRAPRNEQEGEGDYFQRR